MTEQRIPVTILEPQRVTAAISNRQKRPVSLPLLLVGGAVIFFMSVLLIRSGTNYQEVLNLDLAHNQQLTSLYQFSSPDDPMPLYYLFIHFVASNVTLSLIGLRLLSFMCFLLMLPMAYMVAARATGDPRAGVLAATLTAFSPFMVWYASRGTMYAPLALLVLINMYFFCWYIASSILVVAGLCRQRTTGLGTTFFLCDHAPNPARVFRHRME